jgi:hypothetical protein
MDARTDGERFGKLVDQLYGLYHDGYKTPDAVRDAHWKVMCDLPWSEVKSSYDRAIATAMPDKRMPMPGTLRTSKKHVDASGPPSPAQLKAERDSIRHWRALKMSDPITFEVEWRTARAFTAMAQCEDGSEEHAEWVREYQRWGCLRYAPREEQEAAVSAVNGKAQ